MVIGERIRSERIQRQLTIAQLARGAGSAPAHISRIEHGHIHPRSDTVERIAAALGVPVSLLVAEGPTSQAKESQAKASEGEPSRQGAAEELLLAAVRLMPAELRTRFVDLGLALTTGRVRDFRSPHDAERLALI